MATEQLLFGSVAISTIFTETLGNNQFIRLNGNTTNSSNIITDVADNGVNYFGVAELKVGMELISNGPFSTKVTITSISGTSPNATIEVDGVAASSTTGNLLRVDPGPGQAFIESGSMSYPSGQTDINASSVTGSNDSEYVAGDLQWSVAVPVSKDGALGTQRIGQFAQFSLFDVQSRPNGVSGGLINMFITSSGGEMNGFPDGFNWFSSTSQCIIYQVGSENKVGPMFNASDVAITDDFGFAPGQVMASNIMNTLTSGSGGGSGFPFTGSAEITGSLAVTGSSEFTIPVGNEANNFFIKSGSAANDPRVFNVNGEGTIQFFAQDNAYTPTAILGGLYFTSASAYIGIE
ncbi:hypothetical protein N9923_00850 [bacterium]|nr:hypothetical protein [bacterium]